MNRIAVPRIAQLARSSINPIKRYSSTMAATSDVSTYRFNHTQFRIKDPKITLPWYKETLGFEVYRGSSTLWLVERGRNGEAKRTKADMHS